METSRTPVFHRYTVIEKIGSGGMGTVYKAHDAHLDRFVALKVLPPGLQEDAAALERFKREARSLAHLSHPRVAAVYDAHAGDGFPYLVMELVEGENLERYLRRRRALSSAEAVRIGVDIAEALAHIHTHGIVHRDVKSSNIIMEPEKGAVLADFGIALQASLPRLSQGTLGTPEYMSPEQAEGRQLDGRSDLYSLGVVLFECLAGRLPFRREGDSLASLMELIRRVRTEPVLPLEVICPDVPRHVCGAVMRCLAKHPEDRFEAAADFMDALRGARRDEPIELAGLHVPPVMRMPDEGSAGEPYREAAEHGAVDPHAHEMTGGDPHAGRQASGTDGPTPQHTTSPGRDVTVLTHLEAVQTVAFGPNGRLVSGSNDGIVRIWEGRGGRLMHALREHDGSVSAVAFSRDGRFVASGDRLGKICVWDGGTGRLLRKIDALTALVLTLAFSPDGTRLVSGGGDRAVRLWNVRTGKLAETVGRHQGYVLDAAFARDGAKLATSGSDGQVLVWDVERRSLQSSIQAHRGWAFGVDFSANGRRLVSGGADRRVCIWNAANGMLLHGIEAHREAVMTTVFSPSGRYAASAGRDGAVRLWDVRTGAPAGRLGGHHGASKGVTFSPDGRQLAAVTDERVVRVVELKGRGFGPRIRVKRAAAWAALVVLMAAGLWGPFDGTRAELGEAWAHLARSAADLSSWTASTPSIPVPLAENAAPAAPSHAGASTADGAGAPSDAEGDTKRGASANADQRPSEPPEIAGSESSASHDAASHDAASHDAASDHEASDHAASNDADSNDASPINEQPGAKTPSKAFPAQAKHGDGSGERAHRSAPPNERDRARPRAAGPPQAVSPEHGSEDAPARPPASFHPLYGGGALVSGVAGWTIEVGRLRNPRGAAFIAEHYRGLGYRAGVLAMRLGERVEYLVGVGHFPDRLEAESTISKLRSRELPFAIRAARLRWDDMVAVR